MQNLAGRTILRVGVLFGAPPAARLRLLGLCVVVMVESGVVRTARGVAPQDGADLVKVIVALLVCHGGSRTRLALSWDSNGAGAR